MAKGSKKGACSANVQPAKGNCLKHARREGNIPLYVNPHLTNNNRVVFEDALIRVRKSILPLVKKAEKLYTEKTGQKCQKSFTPFREDVLRLKPGITDAQLMAYKAKVEQLTGWKVLGIWLHQDEGHYHSKYIEGDEDFDLNIHAHVLYDCQDHDTGKSIRCTRNYFRLRQDILAECTSMERGNPASETGRKHRNPQQEAIFRQEERLSKLKESEEREKARLEKLKAEQEKAIKDAKENAWHGIKDFFGADSTINGLKAENEQLKSQIKAQESVFEVERQNYTSQAQKRLQNAEKALFDLRNEVKNDQEGRKRMEQLYNGLKSIPIVSRSLNVIRAFVKSLEKAFGIEDTRLLNITMGWGVAEVDRRKAAAEGLLAAAKNDSGIQNSEHYSRRWESAREGLMSIAENGIDNRLDNGLQQETKIKR